MIAFVLRHELLAGDVAKLYGLGPDPDIAVDLAQIYAVGHIDGKATDKHRRNLRAC